MHQNFFLYYNLFWFKRLNQRSHIGKTHLKMTTRARVFCLLKNWMKSENRIMSIQLWLFKIRFHSSNWHISTKQRPGSSFPARALFKHWYNHEQACLEVFQLVRVRPNYWPGREISVSCLNLNVFSVYFY